MEIDTIFVPNLHALKIDGVNVFSKIISDWTNAFYLHNFFNSRKDDLNYFGVSINDAVRITRREINKFRNLLQATLNSSNPNIDQFFTSLENQEYRKDVDLSQKKAKPNSKYWLRIYAIKIEPNIYLIVGGALKLKKLMKDDVLTQNELDKLNRVRDYLKERGIFDYDGFYELTL